MYVDGVVSHYVTIVGHTCELDTVGPTCLEVKDED
jgi:hypothetical protein